MAKKKFAVIVVYDNGEKSPVVARFTTRAGAIANARKGLQDAYDDVNRSDVVVGKRVVAVCTRGRVGFKVSCKVK
jgi:hypothetical protein